MEHEGSIDPDIERLNKKVKKGAANIVTEVLADPEVQNIIKGSLLRETIKNGLFMSVFLVGILYIFNAIKQITNQGPYFDMGAGVALVFIGTIYILSSMHPSTRGKNDGH